MSDSLRVSLDDLKEAAVSIGKLEATTEVLDGLARLASEYAVSKQVNNALPEATEEDQRVVDAYWAGVRFAIKEMMRIIEGVKTHTDNSEKSKKED
jgi:hypothetical protein